MPDWRQQEGQACETILTLWLLRRGFYVCRPLAAHGPVDVVAYDDHGRLYLLDAKKEHRRLSKNRKTATRIHRPLKLNQRLLGVRVAYVDMESGDCHIVPPLECLPDA